MEHVIQITELASVQEDGPTKQQDVSHHHHALGLETVTIMELVTQITEHVFV
jgi:hypothetical protein